MADLPTREELLEAHNAEHLAAQSHPTADLTSHSFPATTVDMCYGPMRRAIMGGQEVLRGGPIVDHKGLVALCQAFAATRDALDAAMGARPTYGFATYARVIDLLKSNLTDRVASSAYVVCPGPYEWHTELKQSLEEWPDLNQEDRETIIGEVNEDMEGHAYSIDFYVEEFDELVAEERQNEESQLQDALQHRLRASVALR